MPEFGSPELLPNKLEPPLMPDVIPRPRLEDRLLAALNAGRDGFLIAPTGWGKTTLVAQALARWDHPAAWVHLDADDNRPPVFWAYVAAALRRIHPDLLPNLVYTPELSQDRVWLAAFAQELQNKPAPMALVLNDFHTIQDTSVLHCLERVLQNRPPALRLILVSQTKLLLNTNRLTLAGQIEVFGSDDLRFTSEEADAFFRETMNRDRVLPGLLERTEGWPSALRIAAQHKADIAAFDGTHYSMRRYLDTALFDTMAKDLLAFMRETAALDALIPAFCEALTGRSDAAAMLHTLADAQLVRRVDERGEAYEYLTPIRDALRYTLRYGDVRRFAELHQRAAVYAVEAGLFDTAVKHLCAAESWPEAERLMRTHIRSWLLRGEIQAVQGWLDALPSDRVNANTRLLVYSAWILLLRGQLDRVEQNLLQAEDALAAHPSQVLEDDLRMVAGEIMLVRSLAAHLRGEFVLSMHHAVNAQPHLTADNPIARGLANTVLGYTAWLIGDLDESERILRENLVRAADEEHVVMRLLTQCNLAVLDVARGRLSDAEAAYVQVIAVTKAASNPLLAGVAGVAQVGLGHILYARNHLERAAELLRDGLSQTQPWSAISSTLPGYLMLAQVETARGNQEGAKAALEAYATHIETAHLTALRGLVQAQRARLALMHGDGVRALRWARQVQITQDVPLTFINMGVYLVYAEAHIAGGQAMQVQPLLAQMAAAAQAKGWGWLGLEIRLVQALALWQVGDVDGARSLLSEVLADAAAQGLMRPFLDRGSPMEALLRGLGSARDPHSFTTDLLAAFTELEERTAQIALDLHPRTQQAEALTRRELEVLHLLAEGLSNAQIAGQQHISTGTVKTHVQNLYKKLGAKNRTQAINIGRKRGLVG